MISKFDTKVIKIDRTHPDMEHLNEAGKILRGGGLVAFPTETVYGLGGDGLQETAAARIYAAKGRPSDNPLILHIAELSALEVLVTVATDSGSMANSPNFVAYAFITI